MTTKVAKKIGFWTAVAMMFGSIVGIGIFFKNGSITRATGDNGVATLLAWVIGGLISLFAAISFSEIGSQKFKNVHGLAAWSEQALGKKFGYFVRFNLPVFYYGILTIIFGVFVSESFFQALGEKVSITTHIIVGLAFDAFFISLNFISVHSGSWISRFSTVLKIVPLILVAVAGIVLATTNNNPQPDGSGHNSFTNGNSFSFTGLLAALPAVLFAYDAFLDAGTLSSKTIGGSKTVSKAIIVTLISVLALYSIISIAHIIHGAGSVSGLFEQVFPAKAQKALGTFVWVFLFFSACGVANGVTATAVTATEQLVRTETSIFSRKLKQKYGESTTAKLTQLVISTFWTLVIFIPALVLKSDSFVDAISNFPTVIFFGIYGATIVGYWTKRSKANSNKINNILWKTASALAVIGITLVVGYEVFYGFTVQAFLHPNDPSHAGFLADNKYNLNLLQLFGIFIACVVAFLTFPIINWFIIRKTENRPVAIDTQAANFGDDVLY